MIAPVAPAVATLLPRTCRSCGRLFLPHGPDCAARYCSDCVHRREGRAMQLVIVAALLAVIVLTWVLPGGGG